MSLDKAIQSGKEHRKPYRGSKAIDRTCRNHGSCPWCQRGRAYKEQKREPYVDDDLVILFSRAIQKAQGALLP